MSMTAGDGRAHLASMDPDRPRPSRRFVGALLPVALLGLIPLTTTAATASVAPGVPVLEWSDCGDGFECATAAVPLDHDVRVARPSNWR